MPNISVLFTKRDIRAITNGDIHWLVAVKLARLSPRAYLYFSTFLWFDDFVASLPGAYSRTPQHQYERVMAFGRHKMQEIHIRTKREREELMQKSNAAAAVTPSGHVFGDDDLIAL
ncbi:hypothetical protein NXS19_004190 [Fusarium pseudograminearum]|uniref:Uncharacterized protein n=2 Tax=Fusarium pseudograminearum TaxID=101028 RepID=K3VZH3_FUSPC|nr:hypothetical protein FPSE_07424 [Fusarium pseudograminearum CS3096]KAF0640816.1 hypothetical protein FPSE5266_07424 [Fusarium pseudograminearum]CEG03199.1 unnamed protein product [Fusarium pseudograminearum CS5834]EKJ72400.1 hypothetical protein FPSE_07424 [Fusarium pseudograminearum CS3096]QPC77833.1 hypothetical protein HYE68_008585 [Fusarium pseudograminearum]UZP36374.1 hypothetical protein NXS19_004190 [Fusarium pseudograminearum]